MPFFRSMTEFIWFTVAGLIGGVLSGMGMGGGTALIPILTIILGVSQHTAQAVNLVSFIPTATISLIVHAKNKLIDGKNVLRIVVPAVLFSIAGSFLANLIKGDILKKIFGIFLIVLSIIRVVGIFKAKSDKKLL